MAKVEMTANQTMTTGNNLILTGETFEAANEEDARLYEEKGLARKTKKVQPSRTQDVQKEGPQPARRGRPPETRTTKANTEE